MHTSEFFRIYVLAEKSFKQATLVETKLVSTTDNGTKPQSMNVPDVAVVLFALLNFMIVWASVVFIVSTFSKVRKVSRDGAVTIDYFKQVPCKNCRFFNNNHHLKCAVHPCTALTKEAINCSDYWPQ